MLYAAAQVSGCVAMKMGHIRNDLIIRTLFWLAVAALWAYLNKPPPA